MGAVRAPAAALLAGCLRALLAAPGLAFECLTDAALGPASHAPRKGIALDDSTLRWCAGQVPQVWPNTQQPMTSIRLFKPWNTNWDDAGREAAWGSLVNYAVGTNAKVFIGTQITCSPEEDERVWQWTKQLVQLLHPEHVMALAVGNELELLQFKGSDIASDSCLRDMWDNGYLWRQFQRFVAEFDQLGFGAVPITSVFTGLGLAGSPFYEVPGKARVNTFLTNATRAYGTRFAFTWNLYPYFDPNMRPDVGFGDQCDGALRVSSCWKSTCVVPSQMRAARIKMGELTGSQAGTLWIGETGWSSPVAASLQTPMKDCPAWSSRESFESFYAGFLEWDMDIGDGLQPPDHIFWFTMRDAANFGEGEHFGLIATCDEPLCKVRGASYEPVRYAPQMEPGNDYCGDAPLFDGFVYGEKQCKDKCTLDPRCMFHGIWPHSHDGHHWCRLTATCEVLHRTNHVVSTYAKQLGPGETTPSPTESTTPAPTQASSTGASPGEPTTPSPTQASSTAAPAGEPANATTAAPTAEAGAAPEEVTSRAPRAGAGIWPLTCLVGAAASALIRAS